MPVQPQAGMWGRGYFVRPAPAAWVRCTCIKEAPEELFVWRWWLLLLGYVVLVLDFPLIPALLAVAQLSLQSLWQHQGSALLAVVTVSQLPLQTLLLPALSQTPPPVQI